MDRLKRSENPPNVICHRTLNDPERRQRRIVTLPRPPPKQKIGGGRGEGQNQQQEMKLPITKCPETILNSKKNPVGSHIKTSGSMNLGTWPLSFETENDWTTPQFLYVSSPPPQNGRWNDAAGIRKRPVRLPGCKATASTTKRNNDK